MHCINQSKVFCNPLRSEMQSSVHSFSDVLSKPLICKQKFLTVSLFLFLCSPHHFPFLLLSSIRVKWDLEDGEERFVKFDFAALDIIPSVLICTAVRSPVKLAGLLQKVYRASASRAGEDIYIQNILYIVPTFKIDLNSSKEFEPLFRTTF